MNDRATDRGEEAGKIVRIGGACGFWGESDMGLPQFLDAGGLDYVVFDYLAEITMSLMARARQKSPEMGYAADFVTDVIAPNLDGIAKAGVKILANAGGVNPGACAAEIRKLIEEAGLDLTVGVVHGDDLSGRANAFTSSTEMFNGAPFPSPERVASINAYIGAFPIAEALRRGADIIITGRCVDSALTLAACIHEFGWATNDWDRLAAGSLAGHIIECGPQACGGNFTDWDEIAEGMAEIGYPIAEIGANGDFEVTKPEGTGGVVSVGSVAEQMLYEIGDPQAYELPDVACDFSDVTITEAGPDRVLVAGARGRIASPTYKASATYADGFKIASVWYMIGEAAREKSLVFANTALTRTRKKLAGQGLADFSEVLIEPFGSEDHFGAFARETESREVAIKIGAKHDNPKALAMLAREATGLVLGAPPGLALLSAARPKPSPVLRLFSLLVDKGAVAIEVEINGERTPFHPSIANEPRPPLDAPAPRTIAMGGKDVVRVPLRALAWGRSGDKGDKANIGVIPRRMELAPYIWDALTEAVVAERFAHF